MEDFSRARIREGDSTTAGGVVMAGKLKTDTMHGKLSTFEGDPVQCPACDSIGHTECVQPYRPNTGQDGRQRNLDGDLCRCKCSPPPRLKAREDNYRDWFGKAHFLKHPGCEGWLAFAGHAGVLTRFDQFFVIYDRATGRPFNGYAYAIRSDAGTYECELYEDAATAKAYSEDEKSAELVYLVQTVVGVRK